MNLIDLFNSQIYFSLVNLIIKLLINKIFYGFAISTYPRTTLIMSHTFKI